MQKCHAAVILCPAGCVFARGKSSGVSGSDENRQKLFCNGQNSGTVRSAYELWEKIVLKGIKLDAKWNIVETITDLR